MKIEKAKRFQLKSNVGTDAVGNRHTPLSGFKLTSSHAGPDERSEVRGQGSGFLAGEEGLGLPTGGVHTQRTAERQLTGARLVGLQMRLNQISQRPEEQRISIERFCSSDVLHSTLFSEDLRVLDVKFV